MKAWTLGAVFLALVSCASPERQLADDRAACERLGFAVASEGMSYCLLELHKVREARSNAILGAGAFMSGQPQ